MLIATARVRPPQAQAAAYVDAFKAAPDCWRLCAERFSATSYAEVKFWCLQTLHEHIRARYGAMDDGSRQMVRPRARLRPGRTRCCRLGAVLLPRRPRCTCTLLVGLLSR